MLTTRLAIACTLSIVLALIGGSQERPSDTYTTEYDDTDVEKILNSKRLLNNYVNCLMERGPCNPDGAELKKHLREALETDCKKCSEAQKKHAFQVLVHLHEKEPEILNELKAKYDADGAFEARLCKRLDAGEIDTHHRCK